MHWTWMPSSRYIILVTAVTAWIHWPMDGLVVAWTLSSSGHGCSGQWRAGSTYIIIVVAWMHWLLDGLATWMC